MTGRGFRPEACGFRLRPRPAVLDRAVLLVGHRAVNKVIIAALIGLDNSHFWRIAQDTMCVNRFHLVEDPQWVGKTWYIISINDACHLRGMKRGAFVDC